MSFSRWLGWLTRTTRPLRRQPLWLERLEDRTLLTVVPVTLADPSLYGVSGRGASSPPSISADGQLVAFSSSADNLVPNDIDGLSDAFVYNRSTGSVTLISVGLNGNAAGVDNGTGPVISPDGRYVVFQSGGSYLEQPILPGVSGSQLFLYDLSTGTTTLLSMSASGSGGGNSTSTDPVFSADSHHIVYLSNSDNLVTAGPTVPSSNADQNLFERDLTTATTSLVSLDGTSTDDGYYHGNFSISADGRFIAYQSRVVDQSTSNPPSPNFYNVVVRDMDTGTITAANVDTSDTGASNSDATLVDAAQSPGDSQTLSADGRYVVFESTANNLVTQQVTGNNVYLRDLLTGITTLVSAAPNGTGPGGSYGGIIRSDGQYVAFDSNASLLPKDTNGHYDVYLYDVQTKALSLLSADTAGTNGGNGDSGNSPSAPVQFGGMTFSADGQHLTFPSLATNLTAGVATSHANLFERNLVGGTTTLVSYNSAGTDGGNGFSAYTAALSAGGSYVAFTSLASNLVADDLNGKTDVFVRDMTAGTTALASMRSPLLPAGFTAFVGGTLGSTSADGRYTAFTSSVFYGVTTSDLAPGVPFSSGFSTNHVFLRDNLTGTIKVIDLDTTGTAVGGFDPVISADGDYVAFVGYTNLLPAGVTPANGHDEEIYVRDLLTNTTAFVSYDSTGALDDAADSHTLAVSADGRYVVWSSTDPGAVAGTVSESPGNDDILFERDTQTGTNYLVNHDLANAGHAGDAQNVSLSSNGQFVLFTSTATDMAANDTNNGADVFEWNRATGVDTLISGNFAGTGPGNGGSAYGGAPVMTPDGRYVAFNSTSSDLLATPTTNEDVFVRDTVLNTTTLVSANLAGTGDGNSTSRTPSISADGTLVAFVSRSSNLTADPKLDGPYGSLDVYVRNLTTGTTTLVSINAAGTGTGDIESDDPIISADGRYVAFQSSSTDLVPGFVHVTGINAYDLYLRDLPKGITKLASADVSGTAGANVNAVAFSVQLSGDSSTLVFDSNASNLFAGDHNGTTDIFTTPTAGFSSISGQVFNDLNGNGAADRGEPGLPYWTVFLDANGNGKLDPGESYLLTDSTGHYNFNDLTPGIYTVSIVPQPGFEETLPTASYSVTITTDGTAITGKNFGEAQPLPDLSTSGVSVSPNSGAPGQSVTVAWTVTNHGVDAAAGSWQDAVYLSPTAMLGSNAVLLATVAHNGGLAVNGNYSGSVPVALPASPGTWYVIVQTDRRDQVDEGAFGANKANNVAVASSTLTIAVPSITLGQPTTGQLTAASPDQYYQLTASAGHSLVVTVASAASSGQIELYVTRGGLPSIFDFDFAARTAGQPGQVLTVPVAQAGVYDILVHGVSGAVLTSGFTLIASEPGLGLVAPGLSSGGNGGQVTIPVLGSDLTPGTQVTLVSGSNVVSPVSIDFINASLLYATFNLAGQPVGTYDLHVADGSESATLAAAFQVKQAQGPNLQIQFVTPSGIRADNPHAGIEVDYENTGDTDMPAPIFQLSTDQGNLQLFQGAAAGIPGPTIQFVGQGADSPGGVLRAGDKGKAFFGLVLPPPNPLSFGGGGSAGSGSSTNNVGGSAPSGVTVTLSVVPTDTTPIDWSQYKSQFQPPSIPDNAWDIVYGNFTNNVGSTNGQLQSALTADTAYLEQAGVQNPTFDQLIAFELLRADDALPVPTLAGTTDVSFPAPGLTLDFSRQFTQSISGRDTAGTLGLGWVSNWDISATTESDDSVLVEDAGAPRVFTPQANGAFQGESGDHGILSLIDGAYQLRETDGTVTGFLPNGQLEYVQDSNGNRINAGYNTGGKMISLTDSDGQALTLAYNPQGLLSTITDPNGQLAATYSYDATGQHLLSIATPQGITRYGYVTGQNASENNALASILNPDGTQVTYTYDDQGRLIGSYLGAAADPIDPVTLSYTSPGGVTFTDANSHATTILYTDLGQPGVLVNALGQRTQLSYDSSGNVIGALLPNGSTYAYTYDANGNLLSQTDPLDLTTNFTYDTNNNLTSYTDAKDQTTKYTYDADSNLLSITYANGAQQQYSYNPLGEATQFLNARGDAIGYAYNTAGLLTGETFADGTSYSYDYDDRGNLVTATDAQNRQTTFIYGGDPNNPNNPDLLTEVTYPDGTFLKFSYYAGGLRMQSVDQTGFTVNYSYDGADDLTSLTDGSGNLIVKYTYDNAGNLTQKDNGNGTRTVYTYDAAGDMLSITNYAPDHTTVNSSDVYTYDTLGNVLADTNQDGEWTYTYDADSQLTQAVFTLNSSNPDGLTAENLQYVYDAAGNRISETVNGVVTTYVTNNVNEYTSSTTAGAGTTTYQYDLDGNLIATTDPGNNTTNYAFNDMNQLTASNGPDNTASYFYDPLSNRVSQTVNNASTSFQAVTTNFQFDPIGPGNVVASFSGSGAYDNSGGQLAHYTYGLGLVSQVDRLGQASYYDFSRKGNTVGITSSAGTYSNRYAYLPFGKVVMSTGSLGNPFTFVGQYGVTDSGSGLFLMRFRTYDVQTGNFISDDPTGLAGADLNLRRYAGNDSASAIDPSGLEDASDEEKDAWFVLNDPFVQIFRPDLALLAYIEWKDLKTAREKYEYEMDKFPELTEQEKNVLFWQGLRSQIEMYNPFGDFSSPFSLPTIDDIRRFINFLFGLDPNNLVGPTGFGAQNFVTPQQPLPYSIEFENDPTKATAAAQDVTVTEQLDPNLDGSTFQLGNIEIGANTITVPAGLQSYANTYDTTNIDGTPLQVDVSASLDQQTSLVTWTFLSIDPATGLTPTDPVAGFLPVDDSTGRGEAFLNYTVQAKATDPTGATVSAQATVVFDINAPLATNIVTNPVAAVVLPYPITEPENTTKPAGVPITKLLGTHVTDSDKKSRPGIAVIDFSGAGAWQYSSNGSSWITITTASDTSALLLPASDQLRFLPAGVGIIVPVELLYVAWDGSQGSAGGRLSAAVVGGATPFSSNAGMISVTVTPVNHSPTWTATTVALAPVLPGNLNPTGQTVQQAFGAAFHDLDGDPTGVAITAAPSTTGGTWQYALYNTTTQAVGAWTSFPSVSASAALLLGAQDMLRFLPNGSTFTGTVTLQLRAWDGTQGTDGGTFNISARIATGGSTAFSTLPLTAKLGVQNPVNDAPTWSATTATLTGSGNPAGDFVLPAQASDPAGVTVAGAFKSFFHDTNDDPIGIAVVGLSGTGAWQYSIDDSHWTAMGTASANAALLLSGTDYIRFLPSAGYVGSAMITVHAWDGTQGASGGTFNLTSRGATGGSTAFSISTLSATGSVNSVNYAPTWSGTTAALPPALPGSTPTGASVSSVFGSLFHDLGGGSVGIGVTSLMAATAQGAWEYSHDDGMSWTPFGSVSASSALLLAGSDLIRFLPAAGFSGTATLIAHAWDGFTGQAEQAANLGKTGGTTAFSKSMVTLSIAAASLAPSWTGTGAALTPVLPGTYSLTGNEPPGNTVTSVFGRFFQDAVAGTSVGIAVTNLTGTDNGTWEYSLDSGTTWTSFGTVSTAQALLLAAEDLIRFLPKPGFLGTATLTAHAWDGRASSGSAGSTAVLNVKGATGGTSAFSATTLTATCLVNSAPELES